MHLHTKIAQFACMVAALAAVSCTCAAGSANVVQFQTKSPAGFDILTISPTQTAATNTAIIHFSHREASSACSFEIDAEANRLPQRGDADDFNEAMPDGSYVRFANYKATTEYFKAISLDISSKHPRFASVTVKLPPSYKNQKCRQQGSELEVLFFGK